MKRILLVDADHTYRRHLREALEQRGHAVIVAGSASEAIQVPDGSFNAVIIDYRLPDTTGLGLLWRWGSLALATPCIILSTHPRRLVVEESLRSGAFEFLEKRDELPPVIETVERALDAETSLLESA